MSENPNRYDIIIIGSGPAGQRAAVQASKAGAKVLVVERREVVGGVCLHAGTIPSKTLREAVIYLRGVRQRHFYGEDFTEKQQITLEDLNLRVNKVLAQELEVMQSQLNRNDVDMRFGMAKFLDANTIEIESKASNTKETIQGEKFIIATGTVPRRPEGIPFDQEVVFDSNFLFSHRSLRKDIPQSLIVVGAGVIGSEYAAMFAVLGCRVWLIDRNKEILRFADREAIALLIRQMRDFGVNFMLGQAPSQMIRTKDGQGRVEFEDGSAIEAEAILAAMGRTPFVHPLNLDGIGVEMDENKLIKVNGEFQTSVPNIYAAGDVIGFPSLASTSGEQGRMAAGYALGLSVHSVPALFPYGIYTIPEISMVGKSEQRLIEQNIPYARGVALYREIPKATLICDNIGALKLLFHKETREILGVHIIGDQASELIHIGQAVMGCGAGLDYFIDTVFNYPTLAEAYKIAAHNGINVLQGKATYKPLV